MKRLLILSFFLVFALLQQTVAQVRAITGKVTDAATNQPLPGVSVLVKGTTTGTATGADGSYSLNVPEGSNTLEFRFIGYQTIERPIGNATTINVSLPLATKELGEVVVTALGIQRTKNELPYAAQSVQGDAVTTTREANFVNALSGKVSGVNIQRNNTLGGSTNVVIRGSKSLFGNNQALFVVDGVPIDNSNTNTADQTTGRGGYDYGNAAADINPDDIESINVLKGAAATALYGTRAANGAIIITTKKGSKERQGIGVTINSSVNVGFIDKSTFTDFQDQYGAGYGAYYEDPSGFFLFRDIDGDGVEDLVVPTSEDASYGAKYDPNLLVYQWNAFDPSSPSFGKKTPWVAAKNDPSEFFKDAVGTANNITLDGGGDKGYFKLGYTRNSDKGILPNSKILKNFVNFAASYDITEKLNASASVNYSVVEGKGRYGTGYDDKNVATNFRQWWQTNVDVKELEDAYDRTGKNVTWNWADPDALVPIYWDNPYWTRYENYQNDNRDRYFGNVRLDYKLTDWLDIMGRISLDTYNELQEERYAVGSLSPSKYQRFNRKFMERNYDLMANLNRDLSEVFNLKATIGTNIRKTETESVFAETNGGLVVPRFYALTNSLNPLEPPLEQDTELQVNGYFASTTLGYKDMAFVDLAYRVDQASTLPSDNNTFSYGSVSGSFVFTELMEPRMWLTNGKVRLNYAEVGLLAPVYYVNDIYAKPTPFGTIPLFSVSGDKRNPDLKPERTKSWEAGLEMSFLDGRTGFDFTYFKSKSVDQIVPASVSRTTGYNNKITNLGEIENRGVELSLYGTPVKTNDFSWTINANWTRLRNEVVDLGEFDNFQLGAFQGGVSINAAVGEPYGTIRGSNFVFNDNGDRVVDEDGYYLISPTSNEVIGNVNPDWIAGISNTVKYKGLSLGFLIDMKHGGDVFSLDQYYGLATGVSKATTFTNDLGNPVRNPLDEGGGVILKGVKEDGTPNDVRVSASDYGLFGYAYNPAAAFVYDASYVKLREVTLGFALPDALISNIGFIKGIELSAYGRNLWIIHKNLPDADPEDGISSGNLSGGYQVGSYPTTRNIGINVKARF
ncbi:SusC/RagA family TonB-linked outer membrane protein [Pontibacter vulgaris]|uniref:SusC/RagA family TonB-linked outer membrane protein n=1 Tax=Pontibacter vulgaris TaxID=2905679 RepID=UPI001FA6ADC6|nr:SusC/RagA family TonB-linked outer membrane protein [Pontibacter vulgaris]